MHYVAQRFGTWKILTTDLEAESDGPEWRLNSYGEMILTIAPEHAHMIAEDGYPIVRRFHTLIHVETEDGRRIWSGYVHEVDPNGSVLEVTVRELHGYLDGLDWIDFLRFTQTDPAVILRSLVDVVQGHPSGDLGIFVTGSTNVRLGMPSEDRMDEAALSLKLAESSAKTAADSRKLAEKLLKAAEAAYDNAVGPLEKAAKTAKDRYASAVSSKESAATIAARKTEAEDAATMLKNVKANRKADVTLAKNNVATVKPADETAKKIVAARKETLREWEEQVRKDGGAWKIEGEDLPDCWNEVTELVTEADVYLTTHTKKTLGKPNFEWRMSQTIGRRRNDLIFEQGINVISELIPESTEYASTVIGVGAGEGDKAIRVVTPKTDARMRRTLVLDDKRLKTKKAVQASNNKELKKTTSNVLFVPEITVQDHPNARVGSWELGDIITVRGTVPHYGEQKLVQRIVGWRMVSSVRAEIYMERV